MKVTRLEMGYVETNTYILNQSNNVIIIDPCLDPGNQAERIFTAVGDAKVLAVLITHGHFDHISGIDAVVNQYHCPVYMYQGEVTWLDDPTKNLSQMMPEKTIINTKPIAVETGDLEIAPFKIKVILTPGHTAMSVSYLFGNDIFDGDFIFNDSIGRTDLPTGNINTMNHAIKEFVFKYQSKKIRLFPGHGPETTLQREIENNLYVKRAIHK